MVDLQTAPAPTVTRPARKRWYRRRPVHRFMVVTHRWTSLILGLVLLAITTSGAILLYAGEWRQWTNGDVYSATQSANPVSIADALEIVEKEKPDFDPAYVNLYDGMYEVTSFDDHHEPGMWVVDPGSGEITGFVNEQHGFMGLMVNIHDCALSCEGYAWYVPGLDNPVPWVSTHWESLVDLTWGGLILAVFGILLVYLAITGAILWWPTLKKFAHGFRVRWSKSRYTRDYDLHQLVGLASVPFLLMWGLTAASFEIPKIDSAWYAVTGGHEFDESSYEFEANKVPKSTEDIGPQAAMDVVEERTGKEVVWMSQPGKADAETGYYDVWVAESVDPYGQGPYPGNVGYYVDRHDVGHVQQNTFADADTLSNEIWDNWRYGMLHFGFAVNGWWRLVWFVFGMIPLLLAWTGVSTWLYKRGVSSRKRASIKARQKRGERLEDVDDTAEIDDLTKPDDPPDADDPTKTSDGDEDALQPVR